MSVSEHERHQILSWFEEHMGSELAPAMMNLIPPAGWGDIATKRDLDNLRAEVTSKFERVDAKFDQVDARFDQVEAKIDGEIGRVRGEIGGVRGEIGELRGEVHREIGGVRGEIGELRGEVHREIGKLRRDMYVVVLSTVAAATAVLSTVIGLR